MSQPTEEPIMLRCLVLDEVNRGPFPVFVRGCNTVHDIWNKIKSDEELHDPIPMLVIWKLKKSISIKPSDTCRTRLLSLGDLSDIANKLDLLDMVSTAFSERLERDNLHIVVTLKQASVPMFPERPVLEPNWALRSETVSELYHRLKEYNLVHVRGTPGSGKTTLMTLLHAHIFLHDPDAIVQVIRSWPEIKPWTRYLDRLNERIHMYFPSLPKNHYFLFDDAQTTYWDIELWEHLFKDTIQKGYGPYAILFCTYGSPTLAPVDYSPSLGSPLCMNPCARMSLTPSACECSEHSPIGLLFSPTEFDQCVGHFMSDGQDIISTDIEFRETLFDWTMGYAGAIHDLLNVLSSDKAISQKLRKRETLTVSDLCRVNSGKPVTDLFQKFIKLSQGLPNDEDFRNVETMAVFQTLLKEGNIAEDGVDFIAGLSTAKNDTLDLCHCKGWLISASMQDGIYYTFPSPLHAIYASWKLMPSSPNCNFSSVRDMTFNVLNNFDPSRLSSPSRIGTAFSERPLEARYQYEFFRGLYQVTNGCVRFCPELLSGQGAIKSRINFFIPELGWGIELTRDGNRLFEYGSGFDLGGQYGVWLVPDDIKQYIIIDCRTDMPELPHPEVENLFHAVFEDNFRLLTILNNKLEIVQGPEAK